MHKDDVFDLVRTCVVEVLPFHRPESINAEMSLADLGADSLERFEIVVAATERLGVTIEPTELAQAANLGLLADVLHRKKGTA